MAITKLDAAGIAMMVAFEGCILHPYRDQVGIPTIGIGCTYYESGVRVTMQDPSITKQRAGELFINISTVYSNPVHYWTVPILNQNQFNALFSFCYNVGPHGFRISSVLSLINRGITDQRLKDAFLLWDKADGKVIDDLVHRRVKEYELYIS